MGDGTDPDAEATGDPVGDVEAPDAPESGYVPVERVDGEPEGHIIRIGEEVTIPATRYANHAVVSVNVYQERALRGTTQKTFVLVYSAGTSIPLNVLEKKQ